MTATPKETKYVSNINYFGDPIYSYSLKEGIEDGFLAPLKVSNVKTDIGDGWRPYKGQTDIYGQLVEDRIYTNSDYDYNIIMENRIFQVAGEITNYLKATYRAQFFDDKKERYPVINIVLYNGSGRWHKPLNLLERIDVANELKEYVNDYKLNLFEIAYMTKEQIKMFQSDFRVVADYLKEPYLISLYYDNI